MTTISDEVVTLMYSRLLLHFDRSELFWDLKNKHDHYYEKLLLLQFHSFRWCTDRVTALNDCDSVSKIYFDDSTTVLTRLVID